MLELLTASSGAVTARLSGRLLHSSHDPVREAQRSIHELAKREPPCVVVMGLGLAYQVEALLDQTDETVILVYEPVEELIREARAARDINQTLDSPRVLLAHVPHQLDEALVDNAGSGFELMRLESRCAIDHAEFAGGESVVDAYRSRLNINRNTVNRFGRLWVRNLCRNVPQIARAEPVSRLTGCHAGVPGILVAAGPTLDQVVDSLPALFERAVIVAVDTAVGTVLRSGVPPDYAVVVDPQYWNSRHLDRVSAPKTMLVSESSAYPTIFGHFTPPHFLCSSVFPLGRRLERALGTFGALGAGGSVSTTAWDLLRKMGCSPIYVAGLDLGFPEGRTHCSGSFFEELAVGLGNRFHTAEQTVHRYIWSAEPREVPANDGGTVVTDRRMEIYRAWFATQLGVAADKNTKTITSGGVTVDGLEIASIEEALSQPVSRAAINAQKSKVQGTLARPSKEIESAGNLLVREISNLAENLSSLRSLASEALSCLTQIEESYHAGKGAEFDSLESIDKRIAMHPAREEASFLMQSAIFSIRAGHGSESIEAQIDASRQLYSSLLDSAAFHEELFRQWDSTNGTLPVGSAAGLR